MTDRIPVQPSVFAAGAVLWRRDPAEPGRFEIAVVHRPGYDDWSLPKGKLEVDETPIMAAVREVGEETGFHARLGRQLGYVVYPVPGRHRLKRVDYWAAEAMTGRFRPNREVDQLRWLHSAEAVHELSYPMDQQIVRRFGEMRPDTTTMIVVRHARAGSRAHDDSTDDRIRPLDASGRRQARALVPNLLAFGPTHVHSADRTRCVQTVAPLAEVLDTPIQLEPTLDDETYAADPAAGRARAHRLAAKRGIRVLCSQGQVIPDLLADWAAKDGVSLPPTRNAKGSMYVLSLYDGRLVAVDHTVGPLPSAD
ncbi:NUDIX hydrolase [Skermania piniformis]|uniref:NUDIX hydrolase n=1 Tax=Skermania pinensis TaxID=39122 RepID=A0ABX8S4J4_9ACTN|nr:bifunctional NUDIX hydrolase/histidine phosphatase family protein [Skermania piniformis]QXQ12734.1 NUDIX hydrolase [Skermania piniformis]